jgi:hypothetical protein
MSVLVEEIKALKLKTTSNKEPLTTDKDDNPSMPTKDDKAPIQSEWWDKYLHLGLLLHVQAGPWAKAARTIHPLVARHWRRLQLRKWIHSKAVKRSIEGKKLLKMMRVQLGNAFAVCKLRHFGNGNLNLDPCFGILRRINKSRCETESFCG